MRVDQKAIDAFFEKAKRLHREEEPPAVQNIIEEECEHDLIETMEGFGACTKCGAYFTDRIAVSFDDFTRSRPVHTAYDRSKHLQQLMLKLNGDFFGRSKRMDTTQPPPELCIKCIRKWMREHKLNAKNDFYYWRLSNDVKCMIGPNDKYQWTSEFKRQKATKAKDFLYKKVAEHEMYGVFIPLLQRKGKK